MNEQVKPPGRKSHDDPTPDCDLLGRFVDHNDQDAFAQLVSRYRGLVLGVCRRAVHDEHIAEDAFQATFLVLAKRASRIRNRSSLGGWLYAVAHRTAKRAGANHHLRREQTLEDGMTAADNVFAELTSRHERQLLDEELNRLSAKYREPLVLRYLMGKSNRQVAVELGLSVGVVQGRLKSGKDELRRCLVKRGIALSTVLAAVGISTRTLEAATTDSLVSATVQAANAFRGGVQPGGNYSQEAIRLAQQELAMKSFQIASITASVAVALVIAGFSLAWSSDAAQQPAPTHSPRIAAVMPAYLAASGRIPDSAVPVQLAMAQQANPPADEDGEADGQPSDPQEAWKNLPEIEAGQLTTRHLAAMMLAVHYYADEHNREFPPPALPNPALAPEKRLSGLVLLLPYVGRRPQNVNDEWWERVRLDDEQSRLARDVFESIDLTKAWDDPANLKAAKTILPMFLAPQGGASLDGQGYATSHFAFVRGADGVDNGAFPLKGKAVSVRSITDGTVNTLGLGQIHSRLGPWIAAGPSTSRHVYHPSADSAAPTFGGSDEGGCYFVNCDSYAYFLDTAKTDAKTLRNMTRQADGNLIDRESRVEHPTAAEWKAAREEAE